MTEHWKSSGEIQEYVDGTLETGAALRRTHHLVDCDDCREELARHHDGLLAPIREREAAKHKEFAAKSGADLIASIGRRIAVESDGGDDKRRGSFFKFLLSPKFAWNLAWAVPLVVLAVFFLRPAPSGRAALDGIFAEIAPDFPVWTGSPGRLIQPFRAEPAEPMRAAAPSVSPELQRLEDELLQLDLPRSDEDVERSTAVATLRLARGEVDSAWQILRESTAERPTLSSLSALACTALLTPSESRLRYAAEALENSEWAEDERIRYNRVLLLFELGERDRARDVMVSLGRDLGADDPWLAQLAELFR